MEKRFPALRTIASVFKILAWIAGIASVIACVVTIAGVSRFYARAGILSGLMFLLWGGLSILILYAWAEGILVILAIEENTRQLTKNE